jgi:hypothetical protein
MKVVSVYQTADGKQFNDREVARRHEAECEALEKLRITLTSSINSELVRRGNIDNVLRHILLESADVRNILASYAKKTPKQQPTASAA